MARLWRGRPPCLQGLPHAPAFVFVLADDKAVGCSSFCGRWSRHLRFLGCAHGDVALLVIFSATSVRQGALFQIAAVNVVVLPFVIPSARSFVSEPLGFIFKAVDELELVAPPPPE